MTRKKLFGAVNLLDLEDFIILPDSIDDGLYKCRVVYDTSIKKIEFLKYQIKKIKSLKLVVNDNIVYDYKYENRKAINQLFEKKENCDDILIVKNGYITDTSFCNIILYDGSHWITPSTPLLKGVKREKLLMEEKIIEYDVTIDDLGKFSKVSLINALLDPEESVLDIDQIFN